MVNYTTYPNITDINFSSSPISAIFGYGNTITGGIAAPALFFMVAIVAFMTLSTVMRVGRAIAASAFVSLITAVAMVGAGVLSPMWLFVGVAYLIIGLYLSGKDTPYG